MSENVLKGNVLICSFGLRFSMCGLCALFVFYLAIPCTSVLFISVFPQDSLERKESELQLSTCLIYGICDTAACSPSVFNAL